MYREAYSIHANGILAFSVIKRSEVAKSNGGSEGGRARPRREEIEFWSSYRVSVFLARSPFYLRFANVAFSVEFDTANPNSDKIPYVEYGDYVAFNNENGGVIESLKEDEIVDIDMKLTKDTFPEWLSTKAMVNSWLSDQSNQIYFADLLWPFGKILHRRQTRAVKQLLGITRDNVEEREAEICRKASLAFEALAMKLNNQTFLFRNSFQPHLPLGEGPSDMVQSPSQNRGRRKRKRRRLSEEEGDISWRPSWSQSSSSCHSRVVPTALNWRLTTMLKMGWTSKAEPRHVPHLVICGSCYQWDPNPSSSCIYVYTSLSTEYNNLDQRKDRTSSPCTLTSQTAKCQNHLQSGSTCAQIHQQSGIARLPRSQALLREPCPLRATRSLQAVRLRPTATVSLDLDRLFSPMNNANAAKPMANKRKKQNETEEPPSTTIRVSGGTRSTRGGWEGEDGRAPRVDPRGYRGQHSTAKGIRTPNHERPKAINGKFGKIALDSLRPGAFTDVSGRGGPLFLTFERLFPSLNLLKFIYNKQAKACGGVLSSFDASRGGDTPLRLPSKQRRAPKILCAPLADAAVDDAEAFLVRFPVHDSAAGRLLPSRPPGFSRPRNQLCFGEWENALFRRSLSLWIARLRITYSVNRTTEFGYFSEEKPSESITCSFLESPMNELSCNHWILKSLKNCKHVKEIILREGFVFFSVRMATESPMRIVGGGETGKWPPTRDATRLASSSNSVATQDLGSLLRGNRFHGNGKDSIPSRSGSAPPSMEGSFSAIRNLIDQQHSTFEGSLANLSSAIENSETEEQLRADPAYLAYYSAHVNLNPRLPPPLVSREKRHLAHHASGLGDNWRLTSFDDSTSGSMFMPRAALSTHKEEPEEEKSPRLASDEWTGKGSGFLSGQYTTSSAARHKSLVDLIQEDFPRTPSPIFCQSRSASHTAAESVGDQDVLVNHLHESSVGATNAETHTTMLGLGSGSPSLGSQGETSSIDVPVDDEELISGVAVSDININAIESKMEGFTISNLPKSDALRGQQEQQPHRGNLPRHQFHLQQSVSQTHGTHSHIANTQGIHRSYNGMDHSSHAHSKLTSVETQPVLHTSGMSPPLYATTATAYMTGSPFYPNLQPSNVFAPQYGIGGYALNAPLLPPLFAGYPQGAIPMAFDNSAGPSFNPRTVGMSMGSGIAPGMDMQHLYKFYGQLGLALPPTFTDPLYMNYFHHPSDDAYSVSGQYDTLTPRGGFVGTQDAFLSQKASTSAFTADQKSHYPRSGALNIQGPRKVGLTSPNSYGSPPGMGVLMQYPTSPLTSPGSPVIGANHAGRKTENFRFPVSSSRNVGAYGWQGHKEIEKLDDQKSYSFLEELKSSKARRFDLSDIAGRIVEFSADQHGSRFIQQKLETCTAEEKASVFEEVLPHAPTLMTDVFGNYVIQKFFEHGSPEQRKQLADQLTGRILPLSLQMYGCRVIQKALEVIELDQKTQLVFELDGHILRCVRDQNGNHVIQKCIECVPTDKIGFIISAFRGQVATLSTHPYGCRVIQRVLEHCTDEQQTQCIVDEILQSASSLAQDQYGNYVTQHVLERGKPLERSQIISKLAGQVVQMSQHKFASNVIEKCLEHGDASERELLIEEIVGQTEGNDNLLIMMKDQFANYVVQKILDTCTDKQREVLLNRIRIHLHALKKYTYGKHIVARVEQLAGEEILASES
ncbi:hypothetical protein H6P81_009239 [Aristolochia fimbriata]|uniref:PUM-HD domain-containing protein n=1 Tax=Aristolochia fimbriata TaxID=158543 RepID=A0AAV7ELL9_ARIFI|nr:hypothetical protein H6P81_009239 [Aristolochia fimbriata]